MRGHQTTAFGSVRATTWLLAVLAWATLGRPSAAAAQDCNTNSIADSMEIAEGSSGDCNTNLVPDECDVLTHETFTQFTNAKIPDNGVKFTPPIAVSAYGTIQDVNVKINIQHTADRDLGISLIRDATTVQLSTDNGGLGDNYTGTVFDQRASLHITNGSAPFTGTYIPEISLSNFNDQDTAGDWVLRVGDDMAGNTGTILNWTLSIMSDPVSSDCNTNAIPDECEAPALDCNTNVVPDECEADCNTNGVVDECETPDDPNDCNTNGINDVCELSPFNETARLTESDAGEFHSFGRSVCLFEDRLIVGAPLNGTGAAYILNLLDGEWVEDAVLVASDQESADDFGRAVAVAGDIAIVGDPLHDEAGVDSGAAFVFRREGGVWLEEQVLTGADTDGGDKFGTSLAMHVSVAVIGAPQRNAAYVFRWNGAAWTEESRLEGASSFGQAVAVHDDVLVVGSNASGGTAHVFRWNGTQWLLEQNVFPLVDDYGDSFAESVAICGDRLVVGAPTYSGEGPPVGAAYIFEKQGDVWSEIGLLMLPDVDEFGQSVAIEANLAVVGSPYDGGSLQGSAFIYHRLGGEWQLLQRVGPAPNKSGAILGWAVSLHQGRFAAGAPAKMPASTGPAPSICTTRRPTTTIVTRTPLRICAMSTAIQTTGPTPAIWTTAIPRTATQPAFPTNASSWTAT